MAPDSSFRRGTGRNNSGSKRDSICIHRRGAVSERVAFMGRYRRVSHLAGGHAPALSEAGNNGAISHCWVGGAGSVRDQRAVWSEPILSWDAVISAVLIGVASVISLVCYVLYYNLGDRAGYFDGMIPLLMVSLTMAGISVAMAV